MTTTIDKTHDLFTRAALSDDDLGYPNEVAFIPAGQEWSERAGWRALHDEHRPVVFVVGDIEVLIEPTPQGMLATLVDRVRRRISVRVGWREHGMSRPSPLAVPTTVGHHPLQDVQRSLHPALA